jgi:hypothetical protein
MKGSKSIRTAVIEWILAACLVLGAAAVWHFASAQKALGDNNSGNGSLTNDCP